MASGDNKQTTVSNSQQAYPEAFEISKKEMHEPMVTLSSTKEARIYNGKKINSLTIVVGKIGQPLVKEWN